MGRRGGGAENGRSVNWAFVPPMLYAARGDIEPPAGNPPLGQIKVISVYYDLIENESAALKKRFNEIFQ